MGVRLLLGAPYYSIAIKKNSVMKNQDKSSEEKLKELIKKAEDEKARTEAVLDAIGDLISIQNTDFRVIYQY